MIVFLESELRIIKISIIILLLIKANLGFITIMKINKEVVLR